MVLVDMVSIDMAAIDMVSVEWLLSTWLPSMWCPAPLSSPLLVLHLPCCCHHCWGGLMVEVAGDVVTTGLGAGD